MIDKKKIIGITCIIGTTICYGLVPSISFLAFDTGVKTETLLFNKFLYATILIWLYIFIKKIPYKLDPRALKNMFFICLSYIGLATTLYLSFNYISGSLATIISFTFPAIIIGIEMITGMEPVRCLKICAVALSTIGMILIVWTPDIGGNITGILFAFGTSLCYVVYIFGLSSEAIKRENSIAVAGYVLLSSALFNGIRCAIIGCPMFALELDQLKYMIILALVCAFFAIILYCIGVKLIGPGNAAIINTFEPVVACIFGYTLVGDILTRNMLIGSGLVVSAVLIANLPARKLRPNHKAEERRLGRR